MGKRRNQSRHRALPKKRNDVHWLRKNDKRQRAIREARETLRRICTENAQRSRDGIAITGEEEPSEADRQGALASGFWFAGRPWHQLATEQGLLNRDGDRLTRFEHIKASEAFHLIKRQWRPRKRKSPLELLAECSE